MKYLMFGMLLAAGVNLAAGAVRYMQAEHDKALDACRAANTGANCEWIVR